MTSKLNYAFSVGKIRALEKFLIKKDAFEEALDTDLNEALKIFVEADLYSEELLNVKRGQDLENILILELSKIKKLTKDLLIDKKISEILEFDDIPGLAKKIKKLKSKFLNDYVRHLVDMHNIKTFLRFYILKEPIEKFKEKLVCEGFIKIKDLLSLYTKELSFLINRLEFVHKENEIINYAFYLQEAILKIEKEKSFLLFEKRMNDFLMEILKPAKYLSFGFEPVIAYYLAKVNEINLIRLIILAKLNDLSTDFIKERLNNVYT